MPHYQNMETAVTYRPALATDTAEIKALIRAVNINPFGLKRTHFIVAIAEDGRIVGCGQIKPHRDGSRELASIAVEKAWRRKGIAATIIQQLLAKEQTAVWLTCMNKLTPFYAQFGFEEVGNGRNMPPYFRQARRFFKLYQYISAAFGNSIPGYLAVMTQKTLP